MKYGSVCSGIEAASIAWEPLGWQPQWFSEIEGFPSAVLQFRFPDIENRGDITKYKGWNDGTIDLLVGGTPCQSFSTAGLRKGLDDPRGNLMLVYLGIVNRFNPKWVIWENVPGVLSSNKGRDFGTFLGALAELGYGFAYRVLNAQFFGVAQRRRRVFVVGYFGDWRPAAAVLFERESLQRDIVPSRKAKKGIAFNAQGSSSQGLSAGSISPTLDKSKVPVVMPEYYEHHPSDGRVFGPKKIANSVTARYGTGGGNTPLVLEDQGGSIMRVHSDNIIGTLRAQSKGHEPIVMANGQTNAEIKCDGRIPTLTCNHEVPLLATHNSLRRITPRECERLQGFPDDWTKIPWKGKILENCPDGPRYKAIGNSMAVPVMYWIGERIQKVEKILKSDYENKI